MIKAAIYARYSSDMQKPESIEDQVRECRGYIESKLWDLSDSNIYTDYAITGLDINRKGYIQLKDAAERREFDYIIVDDLSRLGRNTAESIKTFTELTYAGINIIAISDGIDTSQKMSKVPYYFKSVMNEIFLDDLREKVVRGMKGQVLRGFSSGGRVFGYKSESILDESGRHDKFGRPNRIGVKISINLDESAVVKKIFNLRIQGLGYRAIAENLNNELIPSPHSNTSGRSGYWCPSTIRSILKQSKYRGDWTWNKTKWMKNPLTGKRVKLNNPESEWTKYYSKELRIIPDDLWYSVNKISNDKKVSNKTYASGRRGKYLLSGLLKCHKCGASMILVKSGKYSAYICNNFWSRGSRACDNNHRLLRSEIELKFIDGLNRVLKQPIVINEIKNIINTNIKARLKTKSSSRLKLMQSKRKLEKELANLIAFIEQGTSSPTVKKSILSKEEQMERIDREILRVKQPAKQLPEISSKLIIDKFDSILSKLSTDDDRIVLAKQKLRTLFPDGLNVSQENHRNSIFFRINGELHPVESLLVNSPIMYYSGTGNRTPV